jgi:hypothetical protein
MIATWGGFGWSITPEPAEMKLGRLWAGAAQSIPVRTVPPEVKALRCMMVWIGTAGLRSGAQLRRCLRSWNSLRSQRPSG